MDNSNKKVKCPRCPTFFIPDGKKTCPDCREKQKLEKRARNQKKYVQCNGIMQNDECCTNNANPKFNGFCGDHKNQFGIIDNPNKKRCSGCLNFFIPEHKNETCDICRGRGSINRSTNKKPTNKCRKNTNYDGDDNDNKLNELIEREVRMIHLNDNNDEHLIKDIKETNIRRCSSRRHCKSQPKGVKAQLDEGYKFKKCPDCLEAERAYEKNDRNATKNINKDFIKKGSSNRMCIECKKIIDLSELGKTSRGEISEKCEVCFANQQKNENNRTERDKESERKRYKEYEDRPEIKVKRKEYREDNPEKVYIGYTKCREKHLTENPDAYRKHNASVHNDWVKKNPDKVKNIAENVKNSPKCLYTRLNSRAQEGGFLQSLTFDEYIELASDKCYYCNHKNPKYLNGIDRINSDVGYEYDNCVPCCKMCNYMKNTLNEETFILMCAHIATYSGFFSNYNGDVFDIKQKITRKLYPKVFNNYNSCTYSQYKMRADDRGLNYELSRQDFNEIINKPCYLCGKTNSDSHRNGIDRIDNNIGYVLDNCMPCCGDCNYLKNKHDLFDVLLKCATIARKHKDRFYELENIWEPSTFRQKNINKPTKDEISNMRKEKKIKREEKTLSTKTEEVRNIRSMEIRKKHEEKKLQNELLKYNEPHKYEEKKLPNYEESFESDDESETSTEEDIYDGPILRPKRYKPNKY